MRGGPGLLAPQGRHTCRRHRRTVLSQTPRTSVGAGTPTRLLSQPPGARLPPRAPAHLTGGQSHSPGGEAPAAIHPLLHVALAGAALTKCGLSQALRGAQS